MQFLINMLLFFSVVIQSHRASVQSSSEYVFHNSSFFLSDSGGNEYPLFLLVYVYFCVFVSA